jgi:3-(3-hydroxy-phenyl)propionate hydroxylase
VLKLLKGFTDTSDLTIWRSAVYRFHALLGRGWRYRRVLLMGDAVCLRWRGKCRPIEHVD